MHKSKLDFYRDYNVTGFELCPQPKLLDAITYLKSYGFTAHIHFDTVLASIGRTCPFTRLHSISAKECGRLCRNTLSLELQETYGSHGLLYQPPSAETKDVVPVYLVKENAVFYRTTEYHDNFGEDSIIFDAVLDRNYLLSQKTFGEK
jgi:hypothetical protein